MEGLLACSTTTVPQVDYKIFTKTKKDGSQAWLNMPAMAKELQVKFDEVEVAVKGLTS